MPADGEEVEAAAPIGSRDAEERSDPGAPPDAEEPFGAGDRPDRFEVPVVPGSPSLENALFVLVGVLVALAVVARLFQLFG